MRRATKNVGESQVKISLLAVMPLASKAKPRNIIIIMLWYHMNITCTIYSIFTGSLSMFFLLIIAVFSVNYVNAMYLYIHEPIQKKLIEGVDEMVQAGERLNADTDNGALLIYRDFQEQLTQEPDINNKKYENIHMHARTLLEKVAEKPDYKASYDQVLKLTKEMFYMWDKHRKTVAYLLKEELEKEPIVMRFPAQPFSPLQFLKVNSHLKSQEQEEALRAGALALFVEQQRQCNVINENNPFLE